MLAERPRGSLRIALFSTLALAAARMVCAPSPVAHGRYVEVHVKLRVDGARVGIAAHDEPLFHHLDASVHDARARWRRVTMWTEHPETVVAELERDAAVEQAFLAPEVSLPSAPADAACPVQTPSFESYQGYLGAAPHGIDAPAAWRRGQRGAGVWFADIEGGWNAGHEDLPGERVTHVGGVEIRGPGWRAHGTAVLGEVVGKDNGKGVVGIAPDVERVFTSSIGGTGVADAIDAAAHQLRPGDVLLIELQGAGPRGTWIPVEYWDDAYDAIAAATARGVIVIEAAGNGAENLDHRAYKGKFDRRVRDSGAIVVGAGGPARQGYRDLERLDFSNYGGRVDVQGWGRKVATLDYGDLQKCAGADRHYTGEFSGTSSASPIVAGAAVLVQASVRARGQVLSPAEMRSLLVATGTAQAGDTREHIGPRPDLERAFMALERAR